ncbi:MAG: hypothetical protein K6G90_08880 [Clostridia bacterium]|nr:hypothetical protein [Clostridia bacterium]
MKRSRELESPLLTKIISLVVVFAVCICTLCACLTTYRMSQVVSGSVAAAPAADANANTNSASSAATPAASNNGAAASNAEPAAPVGETDPATVLAKYTEVMDKLKTCKTYNKKEFQDLPSSEYDLGSIGNIILPIANGFLTTEDKAEEQVRDDAHNQIPIINNNKGCLLTDVNAIKSGSIVDNGDGTSTITLVLNDEENPEPATADAETAPSFHGAVFNPMSKEDINNTLAGISAVKVNSFNLTYTGCEAKVTYNNETLEVSDLNQHMIVHITANVKALIVTIDGYANLHNYMHIYNIAY